MDAFHRRISLDEAATLVERALQGNLLHGASAAIFHHLELMRTRIATLHTTFPEQSLHAVAIKANPVVEILREVVGAGAGLEAASLEEVELALAAGCAANRVVFDSPAKTVDEIRQALAWGVYLNADNLDELERIAAARRACESSSCVGLRVNPMVGGGSIAHTSVAASDSKFGVPLSTDRAKIIAAFAEHAWLSGLHVHVGSQGCDLALLAEAARRIAELRRAITAETGRDLPLVDVGGGLPTAYHSTQTAPTPAEYRALLEEQAADLFAPDVRLITEFGRAIQANCGIAVSRVEYVKPAQQLAVIHLGADFLLRTVYRPDDWQHEFFVLDCQGKPKTGPERPLTIAGPLCFAGDVLAREVPLPPVEPGDWIVIRDVGAYTLSMWSRHCSRGIPAVIGYDPERADSLRTLRPRETPADMVRFWGSSGAADHS
jgi:diaminopimelate decarboxylase